MDAFVDRLCALQRTLQCDVQRLAAATRQRWGALGLIGLGSVVLHLAIFWPAPARPGRGQTLTVRLPAAPVAEALARAESPQPRPADVPNAGRKPVPRPPLPPLPRSIPPESRPAPRAAPSPARTAPQIQAAPLPEAQGEPGGDGLFDGAFYRYTLARALARQLAQSGPAPDGLQGAVVLELRAEAGTPPVARVQYGSGHPRLDQWAEAALARALQAHPPRPGPGQVVVLALSVRFDGNDERVGPR